MVDGECGPEKPDPFPVASYPLQFMMSQKPDRRYASDLLKELEFRDKHVLDVGFGNGWLIDEKQHEFSAMTAVESSGDFVNSARERWAGTPLADKVDLIHADIATLALPKELYDLIVFSHSF